MPESDAQDALVVTTFGRRVDIRLASGDRVAARVKGRQLRAVCGDRVRAEPIANESDWLITDILPRTNELTRPDSRGRKEVLAANITLLVCVAADPPKPDWFIVDRYLGAAELMNVDAAVVFNKLDIATESPRPVQRWLSTRHRLPGPPLQCAHGPIARRTRQLLQRPGSDPGGPVRRR